MTSNSKSLNVYTLYWYCLVWWSRARSSPGLPGPYGKIAATHEGLEHLNDDVPVTGLIFAAMAEETLACEAR